MDRYQDFKAWQLMHELSRRVWQLTSKGAASHDWKFRDNIRDAANSAERNFPEGFGRFAPGDFAHFLDHSRASAQETKNQLLKGFNEGYFSEQEFKDADLLAGRALKALAGLQRYLRSPRAKENAKRLRDRMQRRGQTKTEPKSGGQREHEPTNHPRPRNSRSIRSGPFE